MRSPERGIALQRAFVEKRPNEKGRLVKMYMCATCGNVLPAKDVQIDHIKNVGTLKDFDDLPDFVRNLFCDASELQVLCKECHKEKTKKERYGKRSS